LRCLGNGKIMGRYLAATFVLAIGAAAPSRVAGAQDAVLPKAAPAGEAAAPALNVALVTKQLAALRRGEGLSTEAARSAARTLLVVEAADEGEPRFPNLDTGAFARFGFRRLTRGDDARMTILLNNFPFPKAGVDGAVRAASSAGLADAALVVSATRWRLVAPKGDGTETLAEAPAARGGLVPRAVADFVADALGWDGIVVAATRDVVFVALARPPTSGQKQAIVAAASADKGRLQPGAETAAIIERIAVDYPFAAYRTIMTRDGQPIPVGAKVALHVRGN
jgi:hypothetical protein